MTDSDQNPTTLDITPAAPQRLRHFVALSTSLGHSVSQFREDLRSHKSLLSNITPEHRKATPLFYMRLIPAPKPTPSSSIGLGMAAAERYNEIERQLSELKEVEGDDAPLVETRAVETAALVVRQLRSHELAPPELTWLGGEAVIMLWALGNTKYALTVTDDELGYVVRQSGQTIRRKSNISIRDFNPKLLK